MTPEQMDRAIDAAKAAAMAAGTMIKTTWDTPRGTSVITDKSVASIDLVTDTDQACEKLVIELLRAEFPSYEFLGEESSSAAGGYALTDAPTWIIDPIDGTTNFVHRAFEVGVSIGLSVGKEPVLGVMYDPIRGEMYTGRKGGGAFLNGAPIAVDALASELSQAVVCTNIGYDRDDVFAAHVTGTISNLMKHNLRGLRMSGGAVFSLAQVACGRATCFYEAGPHPWDVCAAAAIIIEAGGVAMDMTGGPLDLCSRRYLLANNQSIASKVLECIHTPIRK